MHVETFIHKFLSSVIHKSRLKVLVCVLNALFITKQLKLTSLGRAIKLPIQERSGIRKLDRFLGNKFFQNENICIYQMIVNLTIGSKTRPIIIVDWTKVPNSNYYALRAALATESRAITLYEEIHPKKKENNAKVHANFLKRLNQLILSNCKPIIITDGGFRTPWFREVLKLNWDFIGRIVHTRTSYGDENGFHLCKKLYHLATFQPKFLGQKMLNRTNSLNAFFYIIKGKLKGRKKYTKSGILAKDKDSRAYSRNQRKPLLLVSSLKSAFAARKVTKIYQRRMTIEESFRDMKSSQYGFGFENHKTIKAERFSVWFLLSSLASFIAWVVGSVAEKLNLHYQFQANSIKHRRVISLFYLGCQVIRKKIRIPTYDLDENFNFREIYV